MQDRFIAGMSGSNVLADRHDLFNGNISAMVSTIQPPATANTGPLPQATAYKYDQLNRLIQMQAYANLDYTNNLWINSGLPYDGRYENTFTYDANGNITGQLRKNEAGIAINDLTYKRLNNNGKTLQNRLYHVNDAVAVNAFTDDIDDQGTFVNGAGINTLNNYGFTEIGELNRNNQKEIAEIKYTVTGKVKEVIRIANSSKKNLKFDYDATGNRIAKHIYSSANVWESSEYYIKDAQGNTMSIYKYQNDPQTQTSSFAQAEKYIYGSSQAGKEKTITEMIGAAPPSTTSTSRTLSNKHYNGANHLGNVLTVFTDKKLPLDTNTDGTVDAYLPDVISANDYYPFGVKMAERSFNVTDVREQFNGKEHDKETETSDFGARNLDEDLGVWGSLDPLMAKYPAESPYSYAGNNPIFYKDVDGKFKYPADKDAEYRKKYPMLTKYLESQVKKDVMGNSSILQAYSDVTKGNLTTEKVEEMVTWDSGPEITFEKNPGFFVPGAYGYYDKYFERIELNEKVAQDLEKLLKSDASEDEKITAFLPWFKTLTHEGAHHGDYDKDKNKISSSSEVGKEFENKVWGKESVYDADFDDMYDKDVSKRVIEDQKQKGEGAALPTIPEKKK